MIEFELDAERWDQTRMRQGVTRARPAAAADGPERTATKATAVTTLRRARSHVHAVTTYPFMASDDWSQAQALDAYRAVQAIPAPHRAGVIDLVAGLSPTLAVRLVKYAAATPGKRRVEPISARSLQARMNNLAGLRSRLWELRVAYGPDLGTEADRRAFAGVLRAMAKEMGSYAEAISASLADLAEE